MSAQSRCFLLVALLCLLAGCFDVSDEVWWNADGSARLRRTIKVNEANATPETAKARADAILQSAEFARIDIRKDPRVKSFDVRTSSEAGEVVIIEELEVTDAKDLTAVQQRIAASVKIENAPLASFEWTPAFAFEKLGTGNIKFVASLSDVKPPATFDKEQAKALFGERAWSLKLYGPTIPTASPASALISAGQVEWKTPLAEVAGGQVKESELLAEIGPPPSHLGALLTAALALVVIVTFVVRMQLKKQAVLDAEKSLRPPAPRTMPTVQESGAIPIPHIPSDEALLSDASEINVDADEEVPTAPLVSAQANADAVIKFKCPKCQVELKVPLHLAGRQGKCRKCQGAFVSPIPGQLKQVRAAVAAQPITESASLRDAFSVKKIRCVCGMTSAVLKGRAEGEERCPACNQVLVLT